MPLNHEILDYLLIPKKKAIKNTKNPIKEKIKNLMKKGRSKTPPPSTKCTTQNLQDTISRRIPTKKQELGELNDFTKTRDFSPIPSIVETEFSEFRATRRLDKNSKNSKVQLQN